MGVLEGFGGAPRVLVVVAAPGEARAVLSGLGLRGMIPPGVQPQPWRSVEIGSRFDLLLSGVGKVNAGGAAARVLDASRHGAVISLGVGGALPGSDLAIGSVVAATACVYADEGMVTPSGFVDCAAMGFPLGPFGGASAPVDGGLLERLVSVAGRTGPIATVSTCSGTDDAAREVARRTGALAEGMEGAAVAHVGARLGVPAGELRVISNTTGDRALQRWDLAGALSVLERVAGLL